MTEHQSAVPHIPVLMQPVLDALLPAQRIIDGTLGAGGHTGALLAAGAGEVLGLDADPMAFALAQANLTQWGGAGACPSCFLCRHADGCGCAGLAGCRCHPAGRRCVFHAA